QSAHSRLVRYIMASLSPVASIARAATSHLARSGAGRTRGAAAIPWRLCYCQVETSAGDARYGGASRGRAKRIEHSGRRSRQDFMADEQTQSSETSLSALSDQLADVVQRASKSIVTVAARSRQTATGFLRKTDTETIVLTADHVVEREDEILVTLPDKREVKAQLIGRDPGSDLAALRLSSVDLGADVVPAEVGENLRVGNLVLVIGRPYADGVRVSFGAVSSIEGPKRSSHGGEIEGVI